MRFSAKHGQIVSALLAIQQEVEPIVKDKKNSHLGNKYASIEAITDVVRPLLAKHGVFLMQGVEKPEVGVGVVSMLTRLVHVSGEWVENRVCSPMADASGKSANVQIAGSITTYLRRYGLSAILALTTDEDDDGNAGTKQRKEARRAPRTMAEIANATGATSIGDLPYPPVKGFQEWRHKPLKECPQEAIETAYARTKDDPSKRAQQIYKAMEEELERRRDQNDFGILHPVLAQEGSDNGAR